MTDKQLDGIYSRMDDLFFDCAEDRKKWSVVDKILTELPVEEMGIDELLAYLTTSAWVKSKIQSRKDFVKRAKKRIFELNPEEIKGLMDGLE